MLSTDHAISAESLIRRNVKLTIAPSDGKARSIHGMIAQWRAGPLIGRDLRLYSAQIVPWLWFLGHTSDCRIFQNLNVPDIIEQVFKAYGFSDYQMSVARGDYPKLEYCVQYRESALDFVSRLMEEVGIFYFFRHDDDRHVLVMADSNVSFRDLPDPKLIYAPPNVQSGHVTRWEHSYDFRPGRWAQKDFNFETPSGDLNTTEKTVLKLSNVDAFERFDYPGRYTEKGLGGKLTRTLMEAEEAAHHTVRGTSDYRYLCVGGKFSLQRHPCNEDDKQYVIRRVRHEATDRSHLSNDAEPPRYENTFEAMPYDVTFRPLRVTEKPFVHGPQTAIVVGPPGEKIFTDKYGRVRVQFHWDRYGKRDDKSSCWIRVSHARAGSGWGDVTLPHVGHEVVVSFLEGDPDRPLITGRVYNGENAKAMGMPENKTQTGMKDHSGNEIMMEGKSGVEDIRVTAVKDKNVTVIHDYNETVKTGNRKIDVLAGTHTEAIKGNTSITVTTGAYSHSVAANKAERLSKGESVLASTAANVYIDGATDITVHVGSSSLFMDKSGNIELRGSKLNIEGTTSIQIKAPSVQVDGTNSLALSGTKISSSADASNDLLGATVTTQATGTMNVKGALVKIN